jgi:hypothetical protein
MLKKYFLTAGFGLLLSTAGALAGPITSPPPILSAVGDVTAVYVFADAGDTSILSEVTPVAINQIFCNHTTGGCAANNPGDMMDLGVQAGPMVFRLDDITIGNTFLTNAPDAAGNYHALITTNFSDFNVGALPGGAGTTIANLIALGRSITYIGFEDRTAAQPLGDFDYNDLIFAFANTVTAPPTGVPEPLTISLFGAGLAGAAWLGRRKKNRHS